MVNLATVSIDHWLIVFPRKSRMSSGVLCGESFDRKTMLRVLGAQLSMIEVITL